MEENKVKSGKGIASLVLGIISIVTDIFWYMTIPTGILALILGVKSIKQTGSKLGKTGMILGIIGLSLFLLIYIGFAFVIIAEY